MAKLHPPTTPDRSPRSTVVPRTNPVDPIRHLLLVEDDPVDAEFVTRTIDRMTDPTYVVTHCQDIASAQVVMEEWTYDIALVDLNLPDGRGLKSIERLRGGDARLPIVVLTGEPCERTALSAIEHGAQDVLSKTSLVPLMLMRALRFAQLRQRTFAGLVVAADTDPLTGLPNRRGLRRTFERLTREDPESPAGSAVALFDLDHFKKINDRYGHPCGDACLCAFAERLVTSFGDTRPIFRVGGEEFVVFFPDTDMSAAAEAVEAFCGDSRERPFEFDDRKVRVTASVGVAPVRSGLDWKTNYAAVDRAMYLAKAGGRDRVIRSVP